jgi:stage II sporulation protein D
MKPEEMDLRGRHATSALAALLAACLLVLAIFAASSAEAGSKWILKGRGYGHGVGMSQWGANGFAEQGASYKTILGHYYSKTKLSQAKADHVSVLIGSGAGSVAFANAKRACGRKLKPTKTYVAVLARGGGKVRLETRRGKKMASCGKKLGAPGKGKVEISQAGTYRGSLVARPASGGGGLNVINRVSLEDYLRGVVPYEMPASWPDHALRAQAVAARSYALTSGIDGDGYTLYDDTRSQVYGGVGAEEAATNKAVKKTAGEVVTHKGKTAQTFFYSTSGGHTESSQFGFSGGESRPYLKGVSDPHDDASPYHRWQDKMSRSELQGKLGDWVDGRLRDIEILATGDSPRVVRARIVGTGGRTTVSGFDLQARLGLRSTWVRFKHR